MYTIATANTVATFAMENSRRGSTAPTSLSEMGGGGVGGGKKREKQVGFHQCCGSGYMFLGLLDPDPLVRGMDPDLDPAPDLDPSITKQKNKKNLDSYCFVTSF